MVSLCIFADKVATFPQINKVDNFSVDSSQIYISEGISVFIYSQKDFKLVKKFGKKGEGPEEFSFFARVEPQKNNLIINSMGKISFYTKEGKYIKEIKSRSGSRNFFFLPLGQGFVGAGFRQDRGTFYQTINLYDDTLAKSREIFKYKSVFQMGKKMNPLEVQGRQYQVAQKKILIDQPDGSIKVFDQAGSHLTTIKGNYQKIKFTSEHKQALIESYKANPQIRGVYNQFKDMVQFPKYFPPIQLFRTANGRVYVLTYKRENGRAECYIYNLDGRLIKQALIPMFDKSPQEPFPFAILNGKIYQIYENIDDEEWELHINKIL
jgi:hypothetical protein